MKKMFAILFSFVLVVTLTVPSLAAEPFYANAETTPYDNCAGNRSCPMWYFSDLAGNTWYHDSVHYCLDRMLMVGRTGPEDGMFDPDGSLTRDDLVRILQEPKNALVKQYRKLMEYDGVELEFEEGAFRAVARLALEREIGARGLRSILEGIMTEPMYDIPSDPTVKKIIVTEDTVLGKSAPLLIREERAEDSNAS